MIQSVDDSRNAALIEAAANGDANELRKLLSQGANANAVGEDGETCLHWGAIKGRADIIQELVSHGAALDVKDKSGKTAAQIAEKYGHSDIATILEVASRNAGPNGERCFSAREITRRDNGQRRFQK